MLCSAFSEVDSMRIRAAAAALLLCAALVPGSGRAASSALETAALAWDAGD